MSNQKAQDKHCEYNNFKRARYFHGMLMTDRDFREEQIYHNEKRKLLNRMLHGWGVVCGLGIKATSPVSSKIVITPGLALDCHGNEILVCEDFEVDLKKEVELCPDISENEKDPCAEMKKDKECKYYIAIKHKEVPTDPVAVYTPSGGCEEKVCDYSRTREGFCVEPFKSPPCHAVLPKDGLVKDIMACLQGDNTNEQKAECLKRELEEFHDSFCEQPYPCPTCCCEGESYVVLGTVDFMKTKCRVTTVSQDMISINEGRRYAMTFMFWQYYLGSFFPSIANFLDNPFIIFCQIMKIILEQLSKIVSGEEVLARAEAFTKVTKVHKMSEKDAEKVLAEHKVLYNRTITMTADRVLDIASRAIAMEKIEPEMKVDLVTDKTGKVLFYIPAAEVPEKEELHARLRETENTVKGLQKRIAALELEKKKK
jgi:hypothetical protein